MAAVPVDYRSNYLRAIEKARLSLPPEWRREGWPTEFALLPWPLHAPQHLLALPPTRWQQLCKNLEPSSLTDEESMDVERFVQAHVQMRTVDAYGRLPLSEELISQYGLGTQAALVGTHDKFEIWEPLKLKTKLASVDVGHLKRSLSGRKL